MDNPEQPDTTVGTGRRSPVGPPLPKVFEVEIPVEEVDAHSVEELAATLREVENVVSWTRPPGGAVVVVDLSPVRLLGAAGINELVRFTQRLDRQGGSLLVTGVNPLVARVLALTGTAESLGLDLP